MSAEPLVPFEHLHLTAFLEVYSAKYVTFDTKRQFTALVTGSSATARQLTNCYVTILE
jgi:hypothetical protein